MTTPAAGIGGGGEDEVVLRGVIEGGEEGDTAHMATKEEGQEVEAEMDIAAAAALPPPPPEETGGGGEEEENNDDEEATTTHPPLKKKRTKEFMSWFPSSAHITTVPPPVPILPPTHPPLLPTPSPPPPSDAPAPAAAAGAGGGGGEDVADRVPTRAAHVSKDGTSLVWDAATALELRGKHRMMSRSLGMGSIRVSAIQRVSNPSTHPPTRSLIHSSTHPL